MASSNRWQSRREAFEAVEARRRRGFLGQLRDLPCARLGSQRRQSSSHARWMAKLVFATLFMTAVYLVLKDMDRWRHAMWRTVYGSGGGPPCISPTTHATLENELAVGKIFRAAARSSILHYTRCQQFHSTRLLTHAVVVQHTPSSTL